MIINRQWFNTFNNVRFLTHIFQQARSHGEIVAKTEQLLRLVEIRRRRPVERVRRRPLEPRAHGKRPRLVHVLVRGQVALQHLEIALRSSISKPLLTFISVSEHTFE